jgi:hypothetical protein
MAIAAGLLQSPSIPDIWVLLSAWSGPRDTTAVVGARTPIADDNVEWATTVLLLFIRQAQ